VGYFRPDEADTDWPDANRYTQEAVDAVDQFRADQGWQTKVPGNVDSGTVERLWEKLDEAGKADEVRVRLLDLLRVRR